MHSRFFLSMFLALATTWRRTPLLVSGLQCGRFFAPTLNRGLGLGPLQQQQHQQQQRRALRAGRRGPVTRMSWWGDFFLGGRRIDEEDSSLSEERDPGDVKGTKLKILKYPNPKLRSDNAAVEAFDPELLQRAREMLLVMYAADGIGLAAPQVGLNARLMVFNEVGDRTKADREMVLVNPSILSASEERDVKEEGCLSFPLITGRVERHKWIEVQYQSVTGETIRKRFEGLPARIFQHEYDHLDKVLFIDRLVPEDKALNQKRLDKYVKKYGPGGLP